MSLTTLAAPIFAIVGTIAGVLIQAWHDGRKDTRHARETRELERERRTREIQRHEVTLRHEYSVKWADLRRAAHTDYLAWTRQVIHELRRGIGMGDDANPPSGAEVANTGRERLASLESLATQEALEAAEHLYSTLIVVSIKVEMAIVGDADKRSLTESIWRDLNQLDELRQAYLDLVRQELGTTEFGLTRLDRHAGED